ncbi:MAG TPA: HAMP domain-containing sensor histidine kinase [Chitinophagaceae bacterium]
MSVRLRITLLFTFVVMIIWAIVCGGIYYFSSAERIETIKKRLTNRAITTARLLKQSEIFDQQLIRRIDSSTTLALKRKTVQAYHLNKDPVYYYSEIAGDTLHIRQDLFQKTIDNGMLYYSEGPRDVVAFHNRESRDKLVVFCAAEDADGKNRLKHLKSILALCFIGGTLFSFAGGYIFSRQLLKPVSRIASEVKDISAHSLDRRIKTSRNIDEWHYLATTLNELLDRLKESFELQRRFISNASHELSTPLTLISSQLEISLQRHRNEEEYRHIIQVVLKDVHHMSSLVQTLLKFATASGNPGGLNIDLVRIDEVLMRLPAEMRKKDNRNVVSLLFNDLPDNENTLLVLGNEELLFAAINNVVANACKYSDDHTARVLLKLKDKEFIIEVIDKGIGIDQKELDHIFQPFYRIGEANGIGGFGLGLSLASRIIKLHKGTITVSSTPGQGSTFSIILPAAH